MSRSIYIKKIVFTLFICALLSSAGSVISAQSALKNYAVLNQKIDLLYSDQTSGNAQSYFIKANEGKIGIFSADGELLYTVDVHIKTLPANDQALLSEGIRAKDREELYEILGDYDS